MTEGRLRTGGFDSGRNTSRAGKARRSATRVLSEAEILEREQARIKVEEDIAELFLYSGRFAEAEPLIRAQIERDPENVNLKNDLAIVLTGQEKYAEAAEIYSTLLSTQVLETAQLFNIGVSLFRSGDFVGAGEAFERLTGLQPSSRDAWFNYANALFAAEAWPEPAAAGDRLVELDPLSETAGLIAARAHLEAGDEAGARSGLERTEARPVFLDQLQLRPAAAETQVVGRVVGNVAEVGTPLRLRFTFFVDAASAGTRTVTVAAPARGATEDFEVTFAGRATAYRYEVLP